MRVIDKESTVIVGNRLEVLDLLRGLAVFMVLYFHATNTVENFPTSSVIRLSGVYGGLGVEIFFVISGFVIPYAMWCGGYQPGRHWRRFIYKRLIRIQPAFLMSIIFTLLSGWLVNLYYGRQIYGTSVIGLISHIAYLNDFIGIPWVNPVYWTLAIEMQFYLFIMVFYRMLEVRYIMPALTIVAMMLAYWLDFRGAIFPWLPFFFMGISAYLYIKGSIARVHMVALIVLCAVSALLSAAFVQVFVAVSTAMVIGFVNVPRMRVVSWFGCISYSLYLCHYPIVEKMVRFGKIFGSGFAVQLAVVAGSMFVSIATAWLMFIFIEKPSAVAAARIKYVKLGRLS